MTFTDPIADFLTRIRNAQMARKTELLIPYSKVKHNIADVMKKNNFIAAVEKDESGKFPALKVTLSEKKISLKRVSKPGQRMYTDAENIRRVLNGFGISILSTSQGIYPIY